MFHKLLRPLKKILIFGLALFLISGCVLYFFQEKLLFHPVKLTADYEFTFGEEFEEVELLTPDGITLNALHFKSESPGGVVYYLHGNGGCLRGWGMNAGKFLEAGYDVFFLDYRGYGKSGGKIESEEQFYNDIQLGYDHLKKQFNEKEIVVLGYSIATAAATKLAAENNPQQLILKAPYYDLPDVVAHIPAARFTTLFPDLIFRYEFPTYHFMSACPVPVTIFHGANDKLIYPGSSEKLLPYLKPGDKRLVLPGVEHNNISRNETYRKTIRALLSPSLVNKAM